MTFEQLNPGAQWKSPICIDDGHEAHLWTYEAPSAVKENNAVVPKGRCHSFFIIDNMNTA